MSMIHHFFKSTVLILIFLVSSIQIKAQNTLLFKIEHPKWKTHSYVFGTMHSNNQEVFRFGNAVYEAIEECEIAAFELNLSNKSQQGIREDIMSDSVVSAALLKIKTEFPEKLKKAGISEAELMSKGSTIYAEMLQKLMNPPKGQESRTEAMDVFLQSYATHQGKTVLGIETIQEQLKFLLNFNLDAALDSAISFLQKPDWDKNVLAYIHSSNRIQTIYEGMTLSAICEEVNKLPLTPWLSELLFSRNHIMMERTYPLLEKQSIFMAVGAAHLCGDQGLLNLLKLKGCKITPVPLSDKTDAPAIVWKRNVLKNGAEVETPNVILTENPESGGYNLFYYASDTARVGLIHFEITQNEEYEMEEFSPIESQKPDEVEKPDAVDVPDEEVPYGNDHVGDVVFEGYEEDSTVNEAQNEMAEMLAAKLGEYLKARPADTLRLTGKMGEIEVYKEVKFGITYLTATIAEETQITTLQVHGDPYWMNHPDLLKFFTSYYRKP